jgi:hypothetical protein
VNLERALGSIRDQERAERLWRLETAARRESVINWVVGALAVVSALWWFSTLSGETRFLLIALLVAPGAGVAACWVAY